jgi:transposase
MRRSAISSVHVRRVRSLRQARQQLSGFLLRHGHHYHRPAWTQLHRRWLASLKFEQPVHHIVLEDCIATVEAAMARRDRLETHIEAMLSQWSLASVVQALQALRGVGLVAAATLVAELGDITRFTNPRQLMAYLGLVPSEHSSGGTRRRLWPEFRVSTVRVPFWNAAFAQEQHDACRLAGCLNDHGRICLHNTSTRPLWRMSQAG